jgi:hypothetical protein
LEYAQPDLAAGRAAAQKVITTAKTCPVPEIARLGRTLAMWRTEFLARFGCLLVGDVGDRLRWGPRTPDMAS